MSRRARSQGVTLLEALVAMAVMAIGAVAVVGLQATLRLNSDVSKQRAVAVRLAQEVIEEWRGFSTLAATAGVTDWTDIATETATLTPPDANATYTRVATVVSNGVGNDDPRSKTLHVRVRWEDRSGQEQSVVMNSIVSGLDPQLGGSLLLAFDSSPVRNAGGRNPAIPRSAVDQHDGTSRFVPPGLNSPTWVFNNATGLVTQVCPPLAPCSDVTGMLLSGFVRFATGTSQPTGSDAEFPPSTPLGTIAVNVRQESPYDTTVNCFEEFTSTAVAYYCLVRVDLLDTSWTGKAGQPTVQISGINLVSDINDDDNSKFKICRYTTVRSNTAVVPTDLKNEQSPFRYVNVSNSLTDQNFLVIRAGQSGVAFVCPNDDTATTNVNGATWYHQPSP
jgi:Tfp pilus assembly protein PilV